MSDFLQHEAVLRKNLILYTAKITGPKRENLTNQRDYMHDETNSLLKEISPAVRRK